MLNLWGVLNEILSYNGLKKTKKTSNYFERYQMAVKKKQIRKVLNLKIRQLNDIIADIDSLLTEMETVFYRVCIFGSARIQPDTEFYRDVEKLAEGLAMEGADIVTGGGPGLMEAANKGAKKGTSGARSIGLPIQLPFESDANSHLDVKSEHKRFSSRLDEFMRISHAVVITPGGIGTLLELFYTWQLLQVQHIKPRPFILLGESGMWQALIDFMKEWPLKEKLMSASDIESITICHTVEEALSALRIDMDKFRKEQEQALAEKRARNP